ncbi:MAG TPA: diacylglycerol kinase family protein [Clostridia bacterium]|nr:diacylglycerol kinase family protein [Clostridia bacterium]
MNSRKFFESLRYSIEGLVYCMSTQRNMKIHIAFALIVLVAGILLQISRLEFIIITMAISIVFICEIINTAVEKTVDTMTQEFHPVAKIAKDVAASAVLVAAISSVIVGFLVFGKYLWTIIGQVLK